MKAMMLSPDKADYPSGLLAKRCEEFMLESPGPDWNGVYIHHSK
jgi:hypothetical protein